MGNVIQFETGIEEFSLNGKVSVTFMPTDIHFINRVINAFNEIQSMYETYQAAIEPYQGSDSEEDAKAVYEIAEKADAKIRDKINAVFDKDVCTPTIGYSSILSPAGGLPIWQNMLLSIIDRFDSQLMEEQKKTNPRLAEYTRKYQKRKKQR